jgi:catechol 2,3-dioxygenase-like lactoylglutathione lyase family enzyme
MRSTVIVLLLPGELPSVVAVTSELWALCFDTHDPHALATFWAGVVQGELAEDPYDGPTVLPPDDGTSFRLSFVPSDAEKVVQNRMHFDLTSASLDDQRSTVDRALSLGGRHVDVGQLPEEEHVVLGDPDGNEFCVIEAGNNFLAGCGFMGALSCDGTREVGYFWSAALGWPLVWDQDEETAIQHPGGGTKIAWGGPPMPPKPGKNRLHLDLTARGDLHGEADRLVALGARRIDVDMGHLGGTERVVLADPDDNEFCVVSLVRPVVDAQLSATWPATGSTRTAPGRASSR